MRALVTGGGGFLGKAIVRRLLQEGICVRSLARGNYPELLTMGVEQHRGDLSDVRVINEAVSGCDIVYHVAAKAGVWGRFEDFYQANVLGTRNIIDACRREGVAKLVYTSSPSVVFDGRDMEDVDESVPYPDHYEAFYPQTKAEAERMVLAANSPGLATVALRPHLIWGPEDNHLTPRILDRGRRGKLRRIGTAPCLVDTTYIDNAAEAHLQAAAHLSIGSPVAGKVYFIAQGEPVPLWDMVNRILAAGGLPPVSGRISPRAAYAAGRLLERVYRLFRLRGEPPMTRFVARELSTAHWFDLRAARRDFGYSPKISLDEGMARLTAWLAQKNP